MKEQKDLEQMYRRFSEQAERVPLPTEEQLLELIRQQPQAAAEPKSVRVPLQPTRRSSNTHMWRYAASVLLVVSVGLVAWLMTRPQPAPMVADKQTPATTPAGNTLTNDSTLGDSLVPAVMPLVNYEEALMATQPHTQQLTPQADDTAAGVRVPLPMETYDGGLLSDEVAPIAPVAPDGTDSSMQPHYTPDYNEHQLIKEKDIRANEEADQKTIQPKQQQPTKKNNKRKINLEKTKKNSKKNDVNVIVPQNQQTGRAPRPHVVPTGNGHHTTIWY